jgi:hypothetical protein
MYVLTRASQWSGWIIQQYNSGAIAMGALGKELFDVGKPYFFVVFAVVLGLFAPIPFWLVHRYAHRNPKIAAFAKYINTPIVLLYIGTLPAPASLTFTDHRSQVTCHTRLMASGGPAS